jgi:hypothetical protein
MSYPPPVQPPPPPVLPPTPSPGNRSQTRLLLVLGSGQLRTSIDIAVRFSLDGNVVLAPCTTNGCTATLTISNKVSSRSSCVSVKQPTSAPGFPMTFCRNYP